MEMFVLASVTIAIVGLLVLVGIGIENYLISRKRHAHR